MDAKLLHLHSRDAGGAAGHGGARRGAIVNIVGMGGKIASSAHLPGGAANAALMLLSAGLASAYGKPASA